MEVSELIEFLHWHDDKEKFVQLYTSAVSAGFPSPAEDFLEKKLDLNDYLIQNKSSSFLVRISGHSMKDAGIFNKDVVIVDRSIEAVDGKIVLAVLNGEFTIKRLDRRGNKVFLKPENKLFKTIEVTEEMDFQVWGVVTYCLHKV